jgi:serine/threonine protein kinase
MLADFGLMNIISEFGATYADSSALVGGTTRWMSPELLSPEHFDLLHIHPTIASDVYALGMVILEVIQTLFPFQSHASHQLVAGAHRCPTLCGDEENAEYYHPCRYKW